MTTKAEAFLFFLERQVLSDNLRDAMQGFLAGGYDQADIEEMMAEVIEEKQEAENE